MRVFIAVEFNELKNHFIELQNKVNKPSAKLKEVSTFHLTLKFLGEVPETNIEDIKEKLKKIKFGKFELNLDDVGVFPNEDYIRIIWVGVNPKKEIIDLQQKIDSALDGSFEKDKRFHPHITLARVKFIEDNPSFANSLKDIKADKNKKLMINKFKLIKSTLTPKGPVYEDLETFCCQ